MAKTLLVTGKLAERALRATLAGLPDFGDWEIAVLPITVASLMTTQWLVRRFTPPADIRRIILPGLVRGDLAEVAAAWGRPVDRGPADLKDLPGYFGRPAIEPDYGSYDTLIFAEIHYVCDLSLEEIVRQAREYRAAGADVIDLGCKPGGRWTAGPGVISALKQEGFCLSIDTADPWELHMGVAAGVDYVLSVHQGNLTAVKDCTSPVVVVPDPDAEGLDTLARTAARLEEWGIPYILDPILQPIQFGFARSLHRYVECRRRFPSAEIMLGTHHLTELLAADTTGVNAVIAGFAAELGIRHLLTTEVAPWARGAVRELDIARRLMHYSARHGVLPRRLDDRLLTIKDPRPGDYTEAELREMQSQIRDTNLRIFVNRDNIYVFNAQLFVRGTEPKEIFVQLGITDAGHAFYLGRELMQAHLALTLGKVYRQGQPLSWGYLTPHETASCGGGNMDGVNR